MIWDSPINKIIFQLSDFLTTLLAFPVSYYAWKFLRASFPMLEIGGEVALGYNKFLIIIATCLLWVILFDLNKAYSYERYTSLYHELKILLKTITAGFLLLMTLYFFLRPGYIPRTLVVIFISVNITLLFLERLVLFYLTNFIRRLKKNRKKLLIIGTGEKAKQISDMIQDKFRQTLEIAGFISVKQEQSDTHISRDKVLAGIDDFTAVLNQTKNEIDEVIITLSSDQLHLIKDIIDTCELEGIQVRVFSGFLGKIHKSIRHDRVYGIPLLSISYVPDDGGWSMAAKRLMDILLSGIGLLLLSPLLILVAIMVKLTSPGPVLYCWKVIGFNRRKITSWKFRTMVEDADQLKEKLIQKNEMEGPVFKIKEDPRITKIGRFLRKYSIDELPQLFSVLKGDLSMVGPRPAGPEEFEKYKNWQRRKLSFKSGLTCLWQVSGRNKIKSFDQWVKMDLEYIDNWSLWLDIKIIFKTMIVVLKGTGI